MNTLNYLPKEHLSELHPPTCADDFIGPARLIAKSLELDVAASIRFGYSPIVKFYAGKSGCGKTALALYIRKLVGATRWTTHKISGPDCSIDVIREFDQSLHLCHNEAFGAYRTIEFHEVDKMPPQAQVRWLQFVEDVPPHTCIVCTSNLNLSEMEERFQGRTEFTEVHRPKPEEIVELLLRWPIPEQVAKHIVAMCNGDVRVATKEASEWLKTQPVEAAA